MPELPSPAPSDSSADALPSVDDESAFADILRIEAAAPGDDRPFEDRFKEALNDGVATAQESEDAAASGDSGTAEPVDGALPSAFVVAAQHHRDHDDQPQDGQDDNRHEWRQHPAPPVTPVTRLGVQASDGKARIPAPAAACRARR